MEDNFLLLIWKSFKRTGGFVITAVALIVSFVLWIFGKDYQFSALWVLPSFAFIAVLIVTLLDVAFNSYKRTKNLLPKVLFGRKIKENALNEALCLLEPSSLFAQDSLVSFFIIEEQGFELFIAAGTVITIQIDKKIQVHLNIVAEGHEERIQQIIQNNGETLKKLIVKPGIPQSIIKY